MFVVKFAEAMAAFDALFSWLDSGKQHPPSRMQAELTTHYLHVWGSYLVSKRNIQQFQTFVVFWWRRIWSFSIQFWIPLETAVWLIWLGAFQKQTKKRNSNDVHYLITPWWQPKEMFPSTSWCPWYLQTWSTWCNRLANCCYSFHCLLYQSQAWQSSG